MEKLYLGLALGAAVTAFVVYLLLAARAGGFGNAVEALTLAGRANADPALAERVTDLLGADFHAADGPPRDPSRDPGASIAAPAKSGGDALQLLALFQTEARLVDFLMEDLAASPDAQVGVAAKEIHKKARRVLSDHLTLSEILPGSDGDTVTVPAGFDPREVRVVGNVTGSPPFTGTLQHPGWKVRELRLPTPATGGDAMVIQPAEVELA